METSRVLRTVDGIRLMLEGLSPPEKETALRMLRRDLRPIETPRGGDALSIIVHVLPQREIWTAGELKEQVAHREADVTSRQIFNAIGYLVRHNRLTRLGYGKYTIKAPGVAL